jgi:hypothetical protein
MDESKVAVEGKTKKVAIRKNGETIIPGKEDVETVISINGVNLTLDNSLKKYANDPFFIEHARKVDERFAQNKSKS